MSQTPLWTILVRFPTEIFGSSVINMLELQDCVRLDSAVANDQGRLTLQRVMPYFTTQEPIEVNFKESEILAWLYKRSVTGLHFVIFSSDDFEEANISFLKYRSSINSITVVASSDQSMVVDIVSHPLMLPLLRKLIFSGPAELDLLQDLPNQVQNLEHLKWIYSEEAESWCAQLLTNNPRLKTFLMSIQEEQMGEGIASAIVRAHSLQELVMEFSYDKEKDNLAAIASASAATQSPLSLKKFGASGILQCTLGVGLVQLVQCCPLLQELALDWVQLLEADAVVIFQSCRCLQSLGSNIIISNAILDALVAANPPLQSVHVYWSVTSMDAVDRAAPLFKRLQNVVVHSMADTKTFNKALAYMTGLTKLTFSGALDALQGEAVQSASLTSLTLNHIVTPSNPLSSNTSGSLDNRSNSEIDCSFLCRIAQRNPGLIELTVDCREVPIEVSDALLTALAAHCPGLRRVSLDSVLADTVTDAGVVALARSCAGLREMFLYAARLLTDASLLALAQGCSQLTSFHCRSHAFTEPALALLMDRCPRLSALYIAAACLAKGAYKRLTQRRPWMKLGKC